MKELQEYYNKKQKSLLKICIIIWLVYSVLYALLKRVVVVPDTVPYHDFLSEALSLLLGYGAPTAVITSFYFGYLNRIDKKSWKRKYPQYDVCGEWEDMTRYTMCFNNTGAQSISVQNLPSPVIINQTCRKISIEPSVGEHFTWNSLAAEWDENGFLNILYKVEYKTELQRKNGYPELRYGFEQMHIDTTQLRNGRPVIMKGKFWHCIRDDGKPIYMGDTTYSRRK